MRLCRLAAYAPRLRVNKETASMLRKSNRLPGMRWKSKKFQFPFPCGEEKNVTAREWSGSEAREAHNINIVPTFYPDKYMLIHVFGGFPTRISTSKQRIDSVILHPRLPPTAT